MIYGLIDPARRSTVLQEFQTIHDAERAIGLDPDHVDHGSLSRQMGYVVHDLGMFVPPPRQFYFSIGEALIAGPAVLYGVGPFGDTVPLHKAQMPAIRFYTGVNEIEIAMRRGEIIRPEMAVNGEVFWRWPEPRK